MDSARFGRMVASYFGTSVSKYGEPRRVKPVGFTASGASDRSLFTAHFPFELTISLVDRNQELRKARRILDRPESFERRAKIVDITSRKQADGNIFVTRHAKKTDSLRRCAQRFASGSTRLAFTLAGPAHSGRLW